MATGPSNEKLKILLFFLLLTLKAKAEFEGLDIRGISCEYNTRHSTTEMLYFHKEDTKGWDVDYTERCDEERINCTIKPYISKDRTGDYPPGLVDHVNKFGPSVTWVALKTTEMKEWVFHCFQLDKKEPLGDWAYLREVHVYPNETFSDDMRVRVMSNEQLYDRNIYFGTHVIHKYCTYKAFYYGSNYNYLWVKYRGYIYGIERDPDKYEGLDSQTGLNDRDHLYPRFVIPSLFSDGQKVYTNDQLERNEDNWIIYNDNKISMGRAMHAIRMNEPYNERKPNYLRQPWEPWEQNDDIEYKEKMEIKPYFGFLTG